MPLISFYVRNCASCLATKATPAIKPPVQQRPVQDDRFLDLQIDVVGPLPPSEGHKYLLTVHDRRSRWTEALPMKEASAYTCCETFLREIMRKEKATTNDLSN